MKRNNQFQLESANSLRADFQNWKEYIP